jgi:hypothetical protein
VETLSTATSWDAVDIPTYRAFCTACNLDLMNATQAKRNEIYLKGKMDNGLRHPPLFRYLKKDPNWLTFYKPLMERYVQSIKEKLYDSNQERE